jgi:L-lactate dehydrogenase (cytochrome)
VGDKLEIILDGGVRRGTHVLKALAAGAKACSFGKAFLFSLGAGGQEGVERLLHNMQAEIRRNMILMGCKNLNELNETKIIYRK